MPAVTTTTYGGVTRYLSSHRLPIVASLDARTSVLIISNYPIAATTTRIAWLTSVSGIQCAYGLCLIVQATHRRVSSIGVASYGALGHVHRRTGRFFKGGWINFARKKIILSDPGGGAAAPPRLIRLWARAPSTYDNLIFFQCALTYTKSESQLYVESRLV